MRKLIPGLGGRHGLPRDRSCWRTCTSTSRSPSRRPSGICAAQGPASPQVLHTASGEAPHAAGLRCSDGPDRPCSSSTTRKPSPRPCAPGWRARATASSWRPTGRRRSPLHAEHRPDLVVLDLMLPGMDGLEVCREIQRDGWTPVLMLTAKTEEADKVGGLRGGGGRLPHEAVQPARAGGAGEGDPAPDGADAGPPHADGPLDAAASDRRLPPPGDRGRRGGRPHAARVRDPVRARP